MWSVCKPDIRKAFDDIQKFNNDGIISNEDAKALQQLVSLYDRQHGQISKTQHDLISKNGAESIHRNYCKMNKGGDYYYIRNELYENVSKCPYCSIGWVETLDHYMPKSKYKALSLCRMNLVPMCWNCNGKKLTNDYYKYVHPYYIRVKPKSIFLLAQIIVSGDNLVITFSIDSSAFYHQQDYIRFSSQLQQMDLNSRLLKSSIDYIYSEVLALSTDVNVLLAELPLLICNKERGYGLNDWRCAILRALYEELKGKNQKIVLAALFKMVSRSREVKI